MLRHNVGPLRLLISGIRSNRTGAVVFELVFHKIILIRGLLLLLSFITLTG